MGFLEVAHVTFALPDGRVLLDDVSFRVGERQHMAMVGANGAGKTTLLRVIAGDLAPRAGTISAGGEIGVMRQFIGSISDTTTVRDLLLSLAPPRIRAAGLALAAAEAELSGGRPDAGVLYAHALSAWGDVGGYDAEVLWDVCTTAALGLTLDDAGVRPVRTLSGGEQKRLALEALLHGEHEVLLLDEPDNYLDVVGKRWLEEALNESRKTILFVSHDRELLANTANRIVTVEGRSAWVHGGGFATYHEARRDRLARLDELHRRHQEERERLVAQIAEFRRRAGTSDKFASRLRASESRLRRFDTEGPPPERPKDQRVTMRLAGGRTGVRVVTVENLEITGTRQPFSAEVFYGERVGVLGPNGTGKSHFLRLLAGHPIPHRGTWKLGARVTPGWFSQTHDDPVLHGRTPIEVLWREGLDRGAAMGGLRRYELEATADQPFATLSGGQQARLQILLLEVRGATLLLLDEPTDNLDLASAEALEEGLAGFVGTVVAVTHDRWFMRSFDRFLVFHDDGTVSEALDAPL